MVVGDDSDSIIPRIRRKILTGFILTGPRFYPRGGSGTVDFIAVFQIELAGGRFYR